MEAFRVLFCLMATYCAVIAQFKKDSVANLKAELDDYIDRRVNEMRKVQKSMQNLDDEYLMSRDSSHPVYTNYKHCAGAGVQCEKYCAQCQPGGWCVSSPKSHKYGKCICNYGWTGPNATYIVDTNDAAWGKNRIRADNCNTKCHYTHHVRNNTCAKGHHPNDKCHKNCKPSGGKCILGRCHCCRGHSGPNSVFSYALDRYIADYCDKECPYLGYNKPNYKCKQEPELPEPCNPRCGQNGGKCIKETGKCECCYGWTGPDAEYSGQYHRIYASYCNKYCPYNKTHKNLLCVNPDYVRRIKVTYTHFG